MPQGKSYEIHLHRIVLRVDFAQVIMKYWSEVIHCLSLVMTFMGHCLERLFGRLVMEALTSQIISEGELKS